mmetsp:Transcript_17722/g.32036  ORF Transcript_17722/g.32036 Transcript_17722/m.32036 type:complete len:134 (-) Transcript_17722:105-506(-)
MSSCCTDCGDHACTPKWRRSRRGALAVDRPFLSFFGIFIVYSNDKLNGLIYEPKQTEQDECKCERVNKRVVQRNGGRTVTAAVCCPWSSVSTDNPSHDSRLDSFFANRRQEWHSVRTSMAGAGSFPLKIALLL